MKILRKIDPTTLAELRNGKTTNLRVKKSVERIMRDVATAGDAALVKYTEKFDKLRFAPKDFVVSEAELSASYQNIDKDFINALKLAIDNVTEYHKKKICRSWRFKTDHGTVYGENIVPLENVGIYVPAGQAPLVSSVYMTVIPAKVAGVKNIYVCSPPMRNGSINPYIAAVAGLLKVNGIYKVGGAHAIAAMTYGTKTIPKVDKIIGPGNIYVTEAKRQAFGIVDIDMLAGPSEVVVIANHLTPAEYVITDLLAQAEHAGGCSFLITTSRKLAKEVRSKLRFVRGYIVVAKDIAHAIEISNLIAPEHLQIMVKHPNKYLKLVKNAGAVFLGYHSPTALGDYLAGPSHVLPTAGTARMFSGLSTADFLKKIHYIKYSKKSFERDAPAAQAIATIETLQQHRESVEIRKRINV